MKKKIDSKQILTATVNLSAKQGLLNVSLNEIAAELGIKTPSLYNHISGIEDLYHQLGAYSLKLLENELIQSILGLSKYEALIKVSNTYFDFAIKHPVLYNAIENPYLKNTPEIARLKENIVVIIQSILSVYHLDVKQEIAMIRSLRSYLHGYASLSIGNLFNIDSVDVKESFDLGLDALLTGLNLK